MSQPVPELAGYAFVEPLGKGGYGTVWLAVEEKTQAKVAVKVMPKGRGPARKELEAVIQVNSTIAAGFSERLVRVYGLAEDDRHLYLIMEWMDQGTLKSLIPGARDGADPIKKGLPAREACRYTISILEALQLLHANNLCHRDLKPSNIFIADAQSHRVKIGDYSIVAIRNAESPGGTAPYVPEQTPGDPPERDHRADIYAVGAILFELIFAVNPQYGAEWLYKDREEGRHPLPDPIRAIIERATHPDPDKRYQTAAEMIDDLRKVVDLRNVDERSPPRRRTATVAAILVLCAAVAALVLWMVRGRDGGGKTDPPLQPPEEKRLIAHWTFDETSGATAADGSGNGHSGTVLGAIWSNGTLSFDGVDDHVVIPHSPTLQITKDITVQVWIKSPAMTTEKTIVSKYYNGVYDSGWILETTGSNLGKVYFGGRDLKSRLRDP